MQTTQSSLTCTKLGGQAELARLDVPTLSSPRMIMVPTSCVSYFVVQIRRCLGNWMSLRGAIQNRLASAKARAKVRVRVVERAARAQAKEKVVGNLAKVVSALGDSAPTSAWLGMLVCQLYLVVSHEQECNPCAH